MGERIKLKAADGFILGGYEAVPKRPPRAGVVVLQEIFGVNSHIRAICDRLGAEGYHAVAPALFDRYRPGFETGYSPEELAEARGFLSDLDWQKMLMDADAAYRSLRKDSVEIIALGFCLGGSLAYKMALRPNYLSAAICYYGRLITTDADEKPACRTLMHFGATDHSISLEDVEQIKARRPDCDIHVYPAGHGFNNDHRESYHAESAALAWRRTLDLMADAITE